MNVIEQFAHLFSGNERSFGKWSPETGMMRTERATVKVSDFRDHLNGVEGVGAVPIRDDGTLLFAAIDIDNHGDDKDIDLLPVAQAIDRLSLPLIPCRSKSGGIHCYLFGLEPLNAKLVVSMMSEWAKKLGFPSAEIFPKQHTLKDYGDDKQLGNWINLPYFNAKNTVRYAIDPHGKKLSVEEFIKLAASVAITPSVLDACAVREHAEAPPCIVRMINEGVGPGDRNKALYNMTVYLRRAFPDSYFDEAVDLNNSVFGKPLPMVEARRTIRSAGRREYSYKCGEDPCKSRCDRHECLKRDFGISRDEFNDLEAVDAVPALTDLTRYNTEPVKWSIKVSGREVTNISTDYLYDFNLLRKMFTEQLTPPIFLPAMTRRKWESLVMPMVVGAKIVDVPKEASPSGIMVSRLMDFLSKADSRNKDYDELAEKDRLTRGLPCLLIKDGIRYGVFRMNDFVKYLKSTKSEDMKGAALYFALKDSMPMEHRRIRVRDKLLTVWMVDMSSKIDPVAPDMTPEY